MKITKTLGRTYVTAIALLGAFVLVLGFALPGHNPVRHPHPQPTRSAPAPTPTPSSPIVVDGAFTGPAAPAGWAVTYSRNFATTAGQGDWVTQSGSNAPIVDSTKAGAEYGVGIETTAVSEWSQLVSSNAVVGPSSFTQGLVYIPAGSGKSGDGDTFPAGSTANWPAFWTFGNPWPANGEIDGLEGQTGRSCEQTHYGTSGEIDSPSYCGALGADSTGWLTVSILRQNEQVTVWYNNVKIGTVPLPTTASEKLSFQNQSYSTSTCGNCFGPTLLGSASTAWLSNVRVYAPAS